MSKLDDLRAFAFAAPYLMPLVEKRKQNAIQKLVGTYQGGGDLLGVAAEIAVLVGLENELKQKHNELNSMQEE